MNYTHILVEILEDTFGNDPEVWDDSVEKTAKRLLSFWESFKPPKDGDLGFKFTTFPKVSDQMIIVTGIHFSSLCAHHLLPFFGTAHVAYIPNRIQVGLSKIPRLVNYFAKRPQVQERLTEQIAAFLKNQLVAQGVAVILDSQHTCMTCRGVRKYGAKMVTSVMKGVFLTNPAPRNEFMNSVTTFWRNAS